MGKKKIYKIAEEKAFDYQRELGMIDSVSDDHIVARRIGFYDGFIAGAEWMKAKMMKEAVEGEVENATFGIVYLRKNLTNEGFSTGDKVRVIVIKEG